MREEEKEIKKCIEIGKNAELEFEGGSINKIKFDKNGRRIKGEKKMKVSSLTYEEKKIIIKCDNFIFIYKDETHGTKTIFGSLAHRLDSLQMRDKFSSKGEEPNYSLNKDVYSLWRKFEIEGKVEFTKVLSCVSFKDTLNEYRKETDILIRDERKSF